MFQPLEILRQSHQPAAPTSVHRRPLVDPPEVGPESISDIHHLSLLSCPAEITQEIFRPRKQGVTRNVGRITVKPLGKLRGTL